MQSNSVATTSAAPALPTRFTRSFETGSCVKKRATRRAAHTFGLRVGNAPYYEGLFGLELDRDFGLFLVGESFELRLG